MDSFFSKSLQDVVKGIRSNKRDPKPFISGVIAECKKELREADPFVKANAIRKLTYLLMMGYDMSWADFHVVEVMSQMRFAHKRIG
jgi:AP-3 complex subunit delta